MYSHQLTNIENSSNNNWDDTLIPDYGIICKFQSIGIDMVFNKLADLDINKGPIFLGN